MKRTEVERYEGYPSIDVRCPLINFKPTAVELGCTEEEREKALSEAMEVATDIFWKDAAMKAKQLFGEDADVYAEGRMGRHLCLSFPIPLCEWDAIYLGKWASLCKWAREEIRHLSSQEFFEQLVDAFINQEVANEE
jgi:hypothetical protein